VARLGFPEHEARLPCYGVENNSERRKLIKQGGQHRFAQVQQQQDWAKPATRLDQQAQQQQ